MRISARVTITVELEVVGENWNSHTSIEQLHREGGEMAIERINKLCQRYVRLVGKPKVEAIMAPDR